MKMKTSAVCVALVATNLLCAQGVEIDSFAGNGILTFSDPANSGETYVVEWSPDLNEWKANWESLVSIHLTNGAASVNVPMFYRVLKESINLQEYCYPFGPTALTWLGTDWGGNPSFVETRLIAEGVPVYADPEQKHLIGYADKHYFRYCSVNDVWYEYLGKDANFIYYFGHDDDGEMVRADPPLKFPVSVLMGKNYSATSPLVGGGSVSISITVLRKTRITTIHQTFDDVIEIEEQVTTPDGASLRKVFHAKGIGCVKRIDILGGRQHRELYSIPQP